MKVISTNAGRAAVVVAFVGFLGAVAQAAAPLQAQTTKAKPQRVASLNLASDEILIDILPLSRLVSVTKLVDEEGTSNAVGRVPASIARFPKVDVERLIALKPDLIVVSEYTDADVLRSLEHSGLKAHRMVGLDSFAGFRKALIDLGDAVGEPEKTAALVRDFDARLAAVDARLKGVPRPRVLYWASAFTAGSKTAFDALIRCGGGENAAALAGITGIVSAGAERAFKIDPDWLFIAAHSTTSKEIHEHPLLSKMRAVKDGHVVQMPGALLVALNHHAVTACEFMAKTLHPKEFAQ